MYVILFGCILLICGAFVASVSEMMPIRSGRILGGRVTGGHPYMVAIEDQHECICGGTLIGGNCVLTAAHCVYKKPISKLRAIIASPHLQDIGWRRRIKERVVPPAYDRNTKNMDVAVLKLYDSNIQNILPTIPLDYNPIKVKQQLTILGWGETGRWWYDFFNDPRLRITNVRVYDKQKCSRAYLPDVITDNMFCALGINGSDACEGDSGGPAINNGKQVGIISFGKDCSTENIIPGIYTSLSSNDVKMFLEETIKKLKCMK